VYQLMAVRPRRAAVGVTIPGVVSVVALVVMALLLAPRALAGAGAGFKTGTYVGTTSQHELIKFRIINSRCYTSKESSSTGGATGAPHRGYCFDPVLHGKFDVGYPTINETCSDGSKFTTNAEGANFEVLLSKGSETYVRKGFDTVDPDPAVSKSTFVVHVKHSTATGTITQVDSSENNGAAITCRSGTIRFTAHLRR
jgi:hypothetical protein